MKNQNRIAIRVEQNKLKWKRLALDCIMWGTEEEQKRTAESGKEK